MKFKELSPTQVITTRDFPVHSAEVLERYFEIYRNGNGDELPPVPLIHRNLVTSHFEGTDSALLQEYLRQNPRVEYFLLNGSHRTTSANLTGHVIKGMLLGAKEDIQMASQIRFKGEIYEHGLHDTIIGNVIDLVEHFSGTDRFQTVQQKTDRMVNKRVIPGYMIKHYRGSLR
ncbi:hypothetical protein KKA33_00490 [Patescibacteria group bacterium]|nr:hypothetical protein [Patescibacteria group bacterium]